MNKYCYKCGSEIDEDAEICIKCGVRQPLVSTNKSYNRKDRLTAGLLGLLLGGLGIHKFYLGEDGLGVLYLLISIFGVVLFFIPNIILGIVILIESIVLLTMSDEEFDSKYNL